MADIYDIKTKKRVPPGVLVGPNRLHPHIDELLHRHYYDRSNTGVLARTVVQLLDTLDLICITTECSAIDAGVREQPDHPLNVIAEICRDILDSEQL